MRFLWHCTQKDLRRRLADPVSLALWLGIPLVIGGLMSLLATGNGGVPKARVLIVDPDESVIGDLLAGAGGGRGAEFLDVERVSLEDGRARMDAGEASAMLILPTGLADAILNDEPATVVLVKNPAQRILPGIVQTGAEILVEMVFYGQRLLGESVRELTSASRDDRDFFPSQAVAAFSGSVNDRLRRASVWLVPPRLALDTSTDQAGAAQPTFDFALFMLPGMIFMSILFISQGMADDVWDEKAAGTLRRAASLPHDLGFFLGGKLLAAAVVMAAVSSTALLIAVLFFDVAIARIPLAFAWCVYTGTALFCFFQVLQFAGSTKTGANLVSTVVLFPAMMLGGSFFPFEAMPRWMAAVGAWLPNGQAVVQMKRMLRGAADPASLLVAAIAIGLPALVAFALSARLLRGRFAGEA